MGDRCSGNCCREFSLPFTPAELAAKAFWAFALGEGPLGDPITYLHGIELSKIAQLAVFVRMCKPGDPNPAGSPNTTGANHPVYTCRHFDGANCTVYNERPNMCRDYPYGQPCEHSSCSWDKGRAGAPSRACRARSSEAHAPPPSLEPWEGSSRRRWSFSSPERPHSGSTGPRGLLILMPQEGAIRCPMCRTKMGFTEADGASWTRCELCYGDGAIRRGTSRFGDMHAKGGFIYVDRIVPCHLHEVTHG